MSNGCKAGEESTSAKTALGFLPQSAEPIVGPVSKNRLADFDIILRAEGLKFRVRHHFWGSLSSAVNPPILKPKHTHTHTHKKKPSNKEALNRAASP